MGDMIFLTGPHGSGKTAVAQMLTDYNFAFLDLGGILRGIHQRQNPEIGFAAWCQIGEETRGRFFTDDIIVEEILMSCRKLLRISPAPQDLIIVGSRSFMGIQYIVRRVPLFMTRKNVIIYIDATAELLRERYCEREKKDLTPEEFQQLLDKDDQIGLAGIKSQANISILNVGSEEELAEEVRVKILAGLGYSS